KVDKCTKCGKLGHKTEACRGRVVCFNCGEDGRKNCECKKPKKVVGKVFALSGEDGDQEDNLIR
ncbi:cellular nucleic acid-binding protein, partial [Trifolium medium]|nr:cellular nucleic acid-binding protein [Trifolium medium]